MTQLTLFPTPTSNPMFVNHAEESGSALRSFYTTSGEERMNAYSRFAKSCEQFANENGYSFVEASNKIHSMFNVNPEPTDSRRIMASQIKYHSNLIIESMGNK